MAPPRRINGLVERLAAAEERFVGSEFLAPRLRGCQVCVRLAGVVCRLAVEPVSFTGWGVFRALSTSRAQLVRPAGLGERRRYLELFPVVRLILCQREGAAWLAVPAHQADRRFRFRGLVPVRLAEEVQLFDVVEARCDGTHCWFDRLDGRSDPARAAYLRQALQELLAPERLQRPGLTAEERSAYALAYAPRFQAAEEARRDHTEERLRSALAHAGAALRGYVERADCYAVEYAVAGERHVSVVAKEDLAVQVAGICLSGHDEHFDLQSLVGVVRAAQQEESVVRVGAANQGMEEELYWRVHPRRRRR